MTRHTRLMDASDARRDAGVTTLQRRPMRQEQPRPPETIRTDERPPFDWTPIIIAFAAIGLFSFAWTLVWIAIVMVIG